MIRELKWLLCCWGLCFVFFSHAGSECWMGPGPGPGLSFCPLKYSWIAFVVKWAALLCWFSQISMGRVYWAEIMCNWFVQRWCTEGKKKAVYTDETYPDWPQLIKKKNGVWGKKQKNDFMLTQCCPDSRFRLQEMRQRCSGLYHSAVWPWPGKPAWKQEAFSQQELTPAASTCRLTLLEKHLHWCHISNATTGEYCARVSSFVLGINLVSAGCSAGLMARE